MSFPVRFLPHVKDLFVLSIRKKTALAFYSLLILLVGSLFLAYSVVREVEEKVERLEMIDGFLHDTLEIRRYEKNFILYRMEGDYEEGQAYLRKIEETFYTHAGDFGTLVAKTYLDRIGLTLAGYKDHLQRLATSYQVEPLAEEMHRSIEDAIRTAGKELTDFAELTSAKERSAIKELLDAIRSILVIMAIFFALVSFFLVDFLGRSVVKSLRILEDYIRKMSKGEAMEMPKRQVEEEIRELITTFNRMRNEIQTRQRHLIHSEKLASLGTLLSGVAHELNNPLSNISTSAQILDEELETADPEFRRDLVVQIEEQTAKARDIVRTLLEFARIKEFRKEKLSLRGLLDETMRLFRGQVPSGVRISFDVPEDLTIHADKQRMQQVFLNLIKNSLDALGDKGAIWIFARRLSCSNDKNDEVEIIVEDNGPGIPADLVERIFDPFFTTKDVGKGSGLGLSIVHDIIESHGGSITVDSRPGEGTTFVMWLPGLKEDRE